jgi:myo-inositol catabolism protein IolC
MTPGFDKPLYILCFDYRAPVLSMIGTEEILSDHQQPEIDFAMAEIVLGKHLVYDGFEAALATGAPKEKTAILADERFGEDFLRAANARGYLTACPVEKSGQDEFEFEYGEEFAAHIEHLRPTFCRAQVRYNPEANEELNRRQLRRLQRLSDYLHANNNSLLMLELLVPPEEAQLARVDEDEKAYGRELRPQLAAEAIRQLQDAQVEPDIWSIEALDRAVDYENIVDAVHRHGRDQVGCVVLGEGEGQGDDEDEVRRRLAIAARVPGITGFAAGRRLFWDPLANWLSKSITAQSAAGEIAEHFLEFVDIFEQGPKRMAA